MYFHCIAIDLSSKQTKAQLYNWPQKDRYYSRSKSLLYIASKNDEFKLSKLVMYLQSALLATYYPKNKAYTSLSTTVTNT